MKTTRPASGMIQTRRAALPAKGGPVFPRDKRESVCAEIMLNQKVCAEIMLNQKERAE
jgi:hypothetical protein